MTIDDAFWPYAMLIWNVFLTVGALLVVIRVERELRCARRYLLSPTSAAMQGDAYDDRGLRRMIDQRFADLQARIDAQPQAPAARPAQTGQAAPSVAFSYAARMARQGASVADLVHGCGLNKGEAELLVRLHAQKPGAPPMTH